MLEIGSYEAKTHLPRLLDKIAKGERITITKHGVPIALLVPVSSHRTRPAAEIVREMREFRKGRKRGAGNLKRMIEEGRE